MPLTNERKLELRLRAESWHLEHNPRHQIPVAIEMIIDQKWMMDIVPVEGLLFKVPGQLITSYLPNPPSSICVDAQLQREAGSEYFFSLAHEVAHLLLHQDLIGSARYESSDEYISFMRDLNQSESDCMEDEADYFASHILVPSGPLIEWVHKVCLHIGDAGNATSAGIKRSKITSFLADHFVVMQWVMKRRLIDEGLWESLLEPDAM